MNRHEIVAYLYVILNKKKDIVRSKIETGGSELPNNMINGMLNDIKVDGGRTQDLECKTDFN